MKQDILTDNLQLLEAVKSMPVLRFFEKKDRHKLLSFSKIRQYKAGEQIIAQGSFDNWVYFLLSGDVKVVKDNEPIEELRRTGDIFGEMCIIDGQARSASVYAVGDVACLATDVSFVDNLFGEDKLAFSAVFYQILAETLARRLRETSAELVRAKEEIAALKKQKNN
ncbi:MAG TPA: cyclic nucleotide-binding domain-containing protein [Syntrophales bacterium]|jgi:CRP-like cAMP-binding protein|nr:cyclic nucleotide-binding domain-containing protein [Syntrophales bacterium]HON22167.1 cyclic nucleotide-binding domain-containing protein [Syntrophales bacterium]HOU77375.1 cyclic nucleotide-binding domain-containing protein [Syntrophales bacterium]HPC32503.1 cyclic nucleotide-binding domain-containing protein [Syntrophales bacterium]HQG34124.1 cyclic nucleotide-binding domain-containing protein [Syntrophales bacterium]